jgi:hypothetical protein
MKYLKKQQPKRPPLGPLPQGVPEPQIPAAYGVASLSGYTAQLDPPSIGVEYHPARSTAAADVFTSSREGSRARTGRSESFDH